ncbi:MAG TPA: dienelactone hydrolase family protein [Planctomycetota bacterium]|nr:dienelactone hydrolase family protein [Planctomycetota bacterium]
MSDDAVDRARDGLWSLLGDRPARVGTPSARARATRDEPDYRVEELVLDLNGIEPVPALLIRPPRGDGPWPAVLYNHSHGGRYTVGKRELVEGAPYLQPEPYAAALARAGFAVLAIDHWCFGERYHPADPPEATEMRLMLRMLHRGQVPWGMMVHDSLRAFDWLCAQPGIDARRVGTLGLSMGSTMAWWSAALDPRLAACVDLCCLTDLHAFDEGEVMHAPTWYVPGLLKHWTTARINALIAPRPHLSLAGTRDPLTPVVGLDRIDAELRAVYAAHGAPDAWRLMRFDVEHVETPEMRRASIDFLTRHLAAG